MRLGLIEPPSAGSCGKLCEQCAKLDCLGLRELRFDMAADRGSVDRPHRFTDGQTALGDDRPLAAPVGVERLELNQAFTLRAIEQT